MFARDQGGGGLKVLVAEDWGLVACVIVQAVREMSFGVVGAFATVDEALHAARTQELDGALLDINLNGSMSYPVMDELMARGVPIVILTGYDSHTLPERYRELPCLEKPFGREELVRTLRSVFGYSDQEEHS